MRVLKNYWNIMQMDNEQCKLRYINLKILFKFI